MTTSSIRLPVKKKTAEPVTTQTGTASFVTGSGVQLKK